MDLLTGFLHNAAARHQAVAQLAPSAPSDGYLTGYGDGWEAGQVAGLALALSVLTGASPAALIDDATAAASVNTAFPVEFEFEAAEEAA